MGLNFSQIPEQTNIFIDSNIFLYLFLKHPGYYQECHKFIQRIERGEIIGLINDFVYDEVMHKLMITALINRNHCSPYEAVSFIKREPEILDQLPEL
ncbi:type II toxin-antitoxin system VapC family toxin [Methanospirillum hungatei]|uniref:type II toxin-antitoxin system VapC family toxin n=1 Tax=Methanospirillum hungatei TaxID=2203 RepID=UPI0026EDD4F5|nr:type II toxin-antitoxin system VapC family toxin [Methanospirillum hungatei]MCA1916979.1 type II toxin-antitoxin system VapC family toxin [Methanospirillum hungatei]